MKNLLQTTSTSWAQSVKIALEADGIPAVILDQYSRHGLGVASQVRLAVLNDADLPKAQAIVAGLTPQRTGPPPSWRWQKRGLLLLGVDVFLFAWWASLLDKYRWEPAQPQLLLYALAGVVVILFIGGTMLIFLGPRADKP